MDYLAIFARAGAITKNHRFLWFFGLFLTGAFPLLLIKIYFGWDLASVFAIDLEQLQRLYLEPKLLLFTSLGVLSFSAFGLLTTNISRLALGLMVGRIIKRIRIEQPKNFLELVRYRGLLWKVLFISCVTSTAMVGVLFIFLFFLYLLVGKIFFTAVFSQLGVVLFVGIGFVISCINLFSSLFVIFYGCSVKTALRLSVDLLRVRWAILFFAGILLCVLHGIVLLLTFAVVSVLTQLVGLVLGFWVALGLVPGNFSVLITASISVILFWISTALYSVFFNTSLILIFFEVLGDVENSEIVDSLTITEQIRTVSSVGRASH